MSSQSRSHGILIPNTSANRRAQTARLGYHFSKRVLLKQTVYQLLLPFSLPLVACVERSCAGALNLLPAVVPCTAGNAAFALATSLFAALPLLAFVLWSLLPATTDPTLVETLKLDVILITFGLLGHRLAVAIKYAHMDKQRNAQLFHNCCLFLARLLIPPSLEMFARLPAPQVL